MPKPIQGLLSLVFILQMYLAMLVLGLIYLPYALLNRDGAVAACHAFCVWVRFSLRLICGLRTEIRGNVPQTEVLIAPKHQSFLDIILIYGALPRAKFIMKAELRFAPILGWYAMRIGCVPVNRGKRGAAITDDGGCEIRPRPPRPADHLPARHPRRPGRVDALQDRHRSALQPARPGLRARRHQRRAVLAETRHPAPSRNRHRRFPARHPPPACRMPNSWPSLKHRSKPPPTR